MTKRIYIITHTKEITPGERLVRANSAAQALGYVARDTLAVAIPSQDELIEAAKAGCAVEEATSETAEAGAA